MPKKLGLGIILLLPFLLGFASKKEYNKYYYLGIAVNYTHQDTDDDYAIAAIRINNSLKNNRLSNSYKSEMLLGDQATRKAVLDSLTRLSEAMEDEDLAFVYIGAHGTTSEKGLKICAYDYTRGGAFYSSEIQRILSGTKGRIILIFDTCHAGAALENWPTNNVLVICACRADEYSYGQWFPNVIVSSLSEGDIDHDGLISIQEFVINIDYRIIAESLGKMHSTHSFVYAGDLINQAA